MWLCRRPEVLALCECRSRKRTWATLWRSKGGIGRYRRLRLSTYSTISTIRNLFSVQLEPRQFLEAPVKSNVNFSLCALHQCYRRYENSNQFMLFLEEQRFRSGCETSAFKRQANSRRTEISWFACCLTTWRQQEERAGARKNSDKKETVVKTTIPTQTNCEQMFERQPLNNSNDM